jgi:hypothetical protein
MAGTLAGLAYWPFDALRSAFAGAVQAGWLKKSVLASRDFEQRLAVLERAALGPLARQR